MFGDIVKEDKKGFYTIVAPGTIQSDYDYAVTLTVHNSPEPATFTIGISGPSYNEIKTTEVQPYGTEIIHFEVPPLENGTYELLTEGINGVIFKQSSKLVYKCEKPKVYIQTDKAKYKPGDLVQYRILALDENVKPAKLKEPLNFGIRDGAHNQIKQMKDIQFTRGVHTGKFQLSEQPVLGDWFIDISEGKENKPKTEKSFEVAKYVLPKFSVDIETDKQIALLDKVIKITVRSKYTYGKPVKGKATVTAKFESSYNKSSGAEKTVDVDGKGEVEFNLMDDLNFEKQLGSYMPQINVEAVMTEEHTGLQQNTSTLISVQRSRYTITVPDVAKVYETNKPFEIKAIIKKLNGSPVTNAKSTAKLMIQNQCGLLGNQRFFGNQCGFGNMGNELMFESAVDQNGVANFKLKLSQPADYYSVQVMYEEAIHRGGSFAVKIAGEMSAKIENVCSTLSMENVGPLKLFPQREEPKLGEEFTVDVKSDKNLSYFVYTLMARGKILKHEYVQVTGETKCHTLKMKATFEMVPTAKIFSYFIKDGELRFDEATITITNKFENKLQITAPEEAKPSDVISLNIKTDPDSFVGLLGVDQSVLLLQSGNDFDEKLIFDDLNSYESRSQFGGNLISSPGRTSGFVTLTNATYPQPPPVMFACGFQSRSAMPMSSGMVFGGAAAFKSAPTQAIGMTVKDTMSMPKIAVQPKIRKDFVENWIFDDIQSTDSNGIANFTKKIPDTITSWVITGFSLNDNTGFGMTKDPAKIRVFQPFFLSTNLPYSIKRGEVITIPVVVFNYMESILDAQITMDNSDGEYEFTETNADTTMSKKLSVASNCGETVSFTIRPKIVGEIMLKIKAITPVAGDAIHQKLKVEPEGVTQYENEAFFISIPHGEPIKHALKTKIPSDAVLDSEYLEFSAVGDILGPTIKNIDKLVRKPFGCGEQNMVNFVPNILVLRYLNAINMDMPSLDQKAKNYMETGYQRELTYKHKDGSYSAFGEGSSESNSWLTAYVARSFIQARKYITIDERIIDQALEYLIKTQKDNGQFPQTGKLFHSSNQNDVGVSAFILLAFLEDEDYALKYKSEIEKSLQYLVNNVEKEDDIYTLALILAIFQKVKHPQVASLLERLELKSTFENQLKWWSNSLKYHNNDIEVTAYILQSLVEIEDAGKLLPIIKWLIGQRNSLGGFDSTQDTVVGLQALIKFAEKYNASGDGKMTIQFEAQNGEGSKTTTGTFNVDKDNSLLLQSHVLPNPTRQVTFTAAGEGSSLVQLSYRYNLTMQDDKPSFTIKHTSKQALFPGQLLMNVCAEYKPQAGDETKESNMAVMEIGMPSGYTAGNESLQPIRDAERVQRVETKNDETTIVVYFDSLVAGEPISFDVSAEKAHAVAELKPAPISIYDYYNTEQRATVFYEIVM